jgi:hypothetical protein
MNYAKAHNSRLSRRWTALSVATTVAMCCTPALAQRTAASPCQAQATSVEVTDFGAKGDSASDNVGPFKAAVAYAARCSIPMIHIAAGTYTFVPHGPSAGILLASNLSLVGDGVDRTILQVAAGTPGANFDSLLWARNQDHVQIKGISFIGNSTPISDGAGRPLNTYGAAFSVALDAAPGTAAFGTPRNLAQFLVADSSFENFNGTAWIRVTNYNAAYSIDDVQISNNRFVSHETNAVNPTAISYTSNAISVMGSLTSPAGLVTNIQISRNTINAAHIKGGIALWSGVRGAIVTGNNITDAGADASIPNDAGAYAITVYHNAYLSGKDHPQGAMMGGSRPDDVHIEHNLITRPRSCGIYVASANHVWVVGNTISGQSDPQNHTLPKGAIVFNYPLNATATGNNISSSHIGIALNGGDVFHVSESNNAISNIPAGGSGVVPSRGPPPDFLVKLSRTL